jgi:hypothetical protein
VVTGNGDLKIAHATINNNTIVSVVQHRWIFFAHIKLEYSM